MRIEIVTPAKLEQLITLARPRLTTCTAICRRILPGMPTLPDCRDHLDCKETASSCRSRR